MNTLVLPVSLSFTSDGTSTALVFDLSTQPANVDCKGSQIAGLQSVTMAGSGGAPIAGVEATVAGTVVTVTLPSILPPLNVNSVLIVYVLSFLVQFANAA